MYSTLPRSFPERQAAVACYTGEWIARSPNQTNTWLLLRATSGGLSAMRAIPRSWKAFGDWPLRRAHEQRADNNL